MTWRRPSAWAIELPSSARGVCCNTPGQRPSCSDPADEFVARLTGAADRAYRLLSLATARDALEDGPADGPGVHPDTSLREVLAELVWTGTAALPVGDEGAASGA